MSQKLPSFFYELFDPSLPRLGPGDDASTRRALDTALMHVHGQPPDDLRILDIGCGTGVQTIQLAKQTGATVIAVDNHQPFLDEVMRRAGREGLADRIVPRIGDMHDPGMGSASFDLVWAEGSLFVMGFDAGLAMCHDLLVPRGVLGASELVWLTDDIPVACREYLGGLYPAIRSIDANLTAIVQAGYEVLEYFVLPDSSWLEPYYDPMEARLPSFRTKWKSDLERMALVEAMQMEIDMYRKYADYYGYGFFVMQRQ